MRPWQRVLGKKPPARPGRVRQGFGWSWWYSSNEEYYSGPFATREDAIAEALSERCGGWDDRDTYGRFYLLETKQGPLYLSRYFDGDDALQRCMEAIDDEYGGEDGINWDQFWTTAQQSQLERWLRRVIKLWEWWNGIEITTWQFTNQRKEETFTWHRKHDCRRR